MHHTSTNHPARKIAPNRLGERVEAVLLCVAYGCAVLLVFALAGERAYIQEGTADAYGRSYDNMPYDFLACLMGIVALVGLSWAVWGWPDRRRVMRGSTATVAAFVLAALVFGFYWWEAFQGIFRIDGDIVDSNGRGTVVPMFGYRLFALASTAGAVATLILATRWLRRARSA